MQIGSTRTFKSRRELDTSTWFLLPPGNKAILCYPYRGSLQEANDYWGNLLNIRLATHAELLAANLGKSFPWGNLPEDTNASSEWKKAAIGYGGLKHDAWFVTSDGRFGGAANVPTTLPGSLRRCFLLDGGQCGEGGIGIAENEGLALVCDMTAEDVAMYRKVQLHAAQHVMADGGGIVVTPIQYTDGDPTVFVRFSGRCQQCPSAELISFQQLKKSVPDFKFALIVWHEQSGTHVLVH